MGEFVPHVVTSASVIPAAPPPSTGAGELVTDGWNSAQAYAANAFQQAIQFVDELQVIGDQLVNIPDVTVEVGSVSQIISAFQLPDAPVKPDLTTTFPDAPTQPSLTDVAALVLPDAPQFTAVLPDINLSIAPPTALTAVPATAPVLADVLLPDSPTLTIPDVPDLIGLNIPNAPTISIPEFTATLEELAAAPDPVFSFIEPTYSSTLLDGIKGFLLEWVNGAATGLDPAVEAAIWNRGRAREDVNAIRLTDAARTNYAGSGFPAPPGAMFIAMKAATQDSMDKASTISREVMIKQAELEQQNRQFAVTQGIQLEGQLLTYANQVAQRAFEVANTTYKGVIEIFQVVVSAYGAKVQAYATRAEVWKKQTEVELTKLEVFKAELEAQQLIGTINIQQVEVYKARLQGVLANIEVFKAQIEAANVQSSVNKNTIDAFVAQIQAYGELVKAKTAEYDGYATRVRAEVSKADIFKAQADAFSSQVQGYSALTTAKIAEQSARIKAEQEIPLELYQTQVNAFEKLVGAESARLTAITGLYETDGRVYASTAQAQAAKIGAESDVYQSQTQLVLGQANVEIELAKTAITKITSAVSLLIESIKAGANVSAQLAASALSSINLSGSISDSSSVGSSTSHSNSASVSVDNRHSESLSESHDFKEK